MKFNEYKNNINTDRIRTIKITGSDLYFTTYFDMKRNFKISGIGNTINESIIDFNNNIKNFTYKEYLLSCLMNCTGYNKNTCIELIRIKKDKIKTLLKNKINILEEGD